MDWYGYTCEIEPMGKTGPDLLVNMHKTQVYLEGEVRPMWRGEWPKRWGYILHVPERRGQLDGREHETMFLTISGDHYRGLLYHERVFKTATLAPVNNVHVENGEYFYHVPLWHTRQLSFFANTKNPPFVAGGWTWERLIP